MTYSLKYFALWLVLIAATPVTGQGRSSAVTLSPKLRDSLLVNQYIEIARKRETSPDSAFKLTQMAMVLAKKRGLKKETGLIWYVMGNKLLQKGDRDGCQPYLDSIAALNAQLKDGELTCVLNTLAARKSYSSNDFAKAALYYFRAIQPVRENKVDNPRTIAVLYQNLGVLMTALQEDSLADSYLSIASKYVLKIKPVDSPMLLNAILCQASIYLKNDSGNAIGYYKDAYGIAGKLRDSMLSYTILLNLTESYIFHQQYDSAEHYFRLAKSVTQPGISIIRTEIIASYLAFFKKDYAASLLHLKKALQLTNGEQNQTLEKIYEGFSDTYAALGDYRKAYEFHKKSMYQHTLVYDGQKKIVADFMLNFQALEHEKNIVQQQAEIASRNAALKRQQSWFIAMCVVSSLLCIILLLAYRNYRHKKSLLTQQMHSLLQEQEIKQLKAEAEGADKERSRIAYDLHDGILVRLANIKMNLSGYTEAPGITSYRDVIGQLDMATRELRNTAHNLMPEILLEDGLAQAIFYFCKATEQASGLPVRFQQIGPPLPKLVTHAETAVYRIVQGLIQNIVQHAEATAALVQLQYADNLCSLTVEDNGRGMPQKETGEGYGIRSIRNRVKILHGTFDMESGEGQGTTVYLEFDIRPFLHHPDAAHKAI